MFPRGKVKGHKWDGSAGFMHGLHTYKREQRRAGLWTALHTEAEAHRKQEEVQPKAKGQGDCGEITEPKDQRPGHPEQNPEVCTYWMLI